MRHNHQLFTSDGKYLLFVGIIDTFTEYNFKKRLEYSFKRMFYGKGISCVPPIQYAPRFFSFIKEHVVGPDRSSPEPVNEVDDQDVSEQQE